MRYHWSTREATILFKQLIPQQHISANDNREQEEGTGEFQAPSICYLNATLSDMVASHVRRINVWIA